MKIQIQTKNIIPVEIGELLFHVSMNDDAIKNMATNYEQVGKELKEADVKDLDALKLVYVKALDVLLEEGAGEKIYEKYPSVITLNEITVQLLGNLTAHVKEIFKEQSQLDLMKEYLDKK